MAEESTTIVIFGASGDLTRRKLLPALFSLYCKSRLPPGVRVVGFSRSRFSDDEFREMMWKGVREVGEPAGLREQWEEFARGLTYISGDLADPQYLVGLGARLDELEGDNVSANRLYYLSIAPQLYETAMSNLGASGLPQGGGGWSRVVIEKPFGTDLDSARALNEAVHRVFDESQVYRIDHYLGKETVQNLMVFRFANAIFEPIWNRNYVDNVQITVAEEVSVGDRAGYYDRSGVVRDMVQNHLLQLLTMVAMEPPSTMDASSLRNMKVDVLKAIRRWTPKEAATQAARGQYRGYLSEKGVTPHSTTGTYATLKLYVDNWRWQGVPFYLRTGKSLAYKVSEIVIQFRSPPHLLFSSSQDSKLTPNILSLCLQPDEGTHLKFEAKIPDQGMDTRPVDMEFRYETAFNKRAIPEAYERLLQDALEGDASLFIRSDHIEEAWRIVDPLLDYWQDPHAPAPHTYEPGSWGPREADALLAGDGHHWVQVCGGHGE